METLSGFLFMVAVFIAAGSIKVMVSGESPEWRPLALIAAGAATFAAAGFFLAAVQLPFGPPVGLISWALTALYQLAGIVSFLAVAVGIAWGWWWR